MKEVAGRTNSLLSFDKKRVAWKTTRPTILLCRGNVFTELLPTNDRGIHRQIHRLLFGKTRTAQKLTRPTALPFLRVFLAAGTCLPSSYLAIKGGIYIQTHSLMGGIYEVRR
jgi:hypothetical protein